MQEVMAELRQLGTLDPVAQDELLENLRQSDPSLWPLVMQQFRATAAYRRRAAERVGATQQQSAERLPPVDDVAVAPTETPQGPYPSTSVAPVEAQPPANQASTQVVQASYTAAVEGDWRQRLAGAIEALEAEVPKNPTNVEQAPDAARRAVEAKLALVEALEKVAESAPLVVRNVAFCTEVLSYGCAKRFEKYEFQPNQEVLLYAEVENFVSEQTAKGYHTSLRSSYQILDARGQRVAEHSFAATEEYCQNLRRDFFIGYHLRIPKRIGPGKYALQLSIEDLKCRKVGQASVEFEVKNMKDE